MNQHSSQMDQLTRGLSTVSDKIRALDRAGYARADIARYLDKRYQHVRNVLEADKRKSSALNDQQHGVGHVRVRLGGEGRIVIPASYREAMGVKEGDTLYLRLEGTELRASPFAAVTDRVRAILRKFVPRGTSLVDELLRERRRENKRDSERD